MTKAAGRAAAALAAPPRPRAAASGPGESAEGTADLTVTRDYGAERCSRTTVERPAESDTVMRVLDREAEHRRPATAAASCSRSTGSRAHARTAAASTGSSTSTGSSRRSAPPRSRVRGGDRIWWDYRDWTDGDARPGRGRLVARAVRPGVARAASRSRCGSTAPADQKPATRSRRRLDDAGVEAMGVGCDERRVSAGRSGCSSVPGSCGRCATTRASRIAGPAQAAACSPLRARGTAAGELVGPRRRRRVPASAWAPAPAWSPRCGRARTRPTWVVTGTDDDGRRRGGRLLWTRATCATATRSP